MKQFYIYTPVYLYEYVSLFVCRAKRSYDDFRAEIADCAPGRCTLMKCTVGPLLKDESVIFRIRSRLFTETQINTYKDKVKVSSKLVTRITRLPYLADASRVEYKVRGRGIERVREN